VVRVKLIDDTPLFGNELIQSADDAIFLMQKELRNCDRKLLETVAFSNGCICFKELIQLQHTHFHPSGELTPSEEDKKATKRLEMAGQILGIPVVDHIIVGECKENYYSFRANDLLNPDEEKRKRKQKKQSPKHKEQEAR